MRAQRIDVLHVGSASRDLTPDDPRGWRLGGGVTYAALHDRSSRAADRGVSSASTTTAAGAHELELLADAGVDLMLSAPSARRPSSTTGDARRSRPDLPRRRACRSHPGARRRRGSAASVWSLVPVAGEIGDGWAAAIPPGALVAVGWQGFLRELAAGRARRAASADTIAGRPPGRPGRGQPARSRAGDQPRVARGVPASRRGPARDAGPSAAGSLVVAGGGRSAEALALPADRDRPARSTRPGAGDTFLAALLVSVLRPALVGRARSRRRPDLRFAAAAGSLAGRGSGAVGGPGPGGRPGPARARACAPCGRPERGVTGRHGRPRPRLTRPTGGRPPARWRGADAGA